MAAAKLTAAKIAAAHARAEADEASFHEREKLAEEKGSHEYPNHDMDEERERNRLRKLDTQTGREWDAEKREEDYSDHSSGGPYRRGMHGAVMGYSRRGDEIDVSADNGFDHVGRGQGGGGWRAGRGSSRGGRVESIPRNEDPDPVATDAFPDPGIGDDGEFLALPGADSTTASGSGSNVNAFTYDNGNTASSTPLSPW